MIAYKVLRVVGNRYFSAVADHTDLRVEYKLNEWSKPAANHTRLFVFEDLSKATYWKDSFFGIDFKIAEVEVEGVEQHPLDYFVFPLSEYIFGWVKYKIRERDFPAPPLPRGSMLVERLLFLRVVDN